MLERALEEEAEIEREERDGAQARLAKVQAERANRQTLQEGAAKMAVGDLQREVHMDEVRYDPFDLLYEIECLPTDHRQGPSEPRE